jgi:hypothetical protein
MIIDTKTIQLLISLIIVLLVAVWFLWSRRFPRPRPAKGTTPIPARQTLSPQEVFRLVMEGKIPDAKANISPDGQYAVVVSSISMLMSHWIESGEVWIIASSTMLTPIGEWRWSIDRLVWAGDHGLTVDVRRYPGDVAGGTITLDLDQQTAAITFNTEQVTIPFAQLTDWLESYYARHTRIKH